MLDRWQTDQEFRNKLIDKHPTMPAVLLATLMLVDDHVPA